MAAHAVTFQQHEQECINVRLGKTDWLLCFSTFAKHPVLVTMSYPEHKRREGSPRRSPRRSGEMRESDDVGAIYPALEGPPAGVFSPHQWIYVEDAHPSEGPGADGWAHALAELK
jgi:hypothetical protein